MASLILGIHSGLPHPDFTQLGNIDGEKDKIESPFLGSSTGAILRPMLGGIIGDAFGVQAILLGFMLPFGTLAFYTF